MLDAAVDATGSGHYLNVFWFDPALPERRPEPLPCFHHFEDIGIVSARTGWAGNESLLVVKCGPPLGHKHVETRRDYGAGHVHPDAGLVLFFAGGKFLLCDDGYAMPKTSAGHSTVLVNGRGQKGEGRTWFDFAPWLHDRRAPRIVTAHSSPDRDRIVCDVAPAYPPELGVTVFERTVTFDKPDRLAVADRVALSQASGLEWQFPFEEPLKDEGEHRFTTGDPAWVVTIAADCPADVSLSEHKRAHVLVLKPRAPVAAASVTLTLTPRPAGP
jgi:hypothetical protein